MASAAMPSVVSASRRDRTAATKHKGSRMFV